MSQKAVEQFLGRAITDDRFRERAQASLELSCLSEGFALSKAEALQLAKIDFSLLSYIGTTLDDELRR